MNDMRRLLKYMGSYKKDMVLGGVPDGVPEGSKVISADLKV